MTIAYTNANRPYQSYGAAIPAWKSGRREVLLAGPAGTGKSRLWLQRLHFQAMKYPGMRGLICRKTRESITQTAMVTYEKKVVPEGWFDAGIVHFRTQEQEYRYSNGSILAIGGLDKASKIMSSEYDIIYVMEATELLEEDYASLTTRLRNGVMPYQQLVADCNPGPPTHWLKQRADRGETLMLESRHEDNPTVTKAYLDTLDALPGVLYLRLRLGKWAAAEGMVYELWDRTTHIVSRKQLTAWGLMLPDGELNRWTVKRVFASVDWGFTNPGVIQVWMLDGDGRMFLIREIYQTGHDINWWIAQAQALSREFDALDLPIELFVCDPSEPAYISQFNGAGLNAVGAVNDIAPGISLLQSRLQSARDGRPRFYVYEYALQGRDPARTQAHRPCGFVEEIDGYVWPPVKPGHPVKEKPVKEDDHSMDAGRYAVLWLDNGGDVQPLDVDTVNAISQFRGY